MIRIVRFIPICLAQALVVPCAIWIRFGGWACGSGVRGGVVPLTLSFSQVPWDEVWQRPQEYACLTAYRGAVVFLAPVQVHEWIGRIGRRWRPFQMILGDWVPFPMAVLSPLVFSGHFKSRFVFDLNTALMAWATAPWVADTPAARIVTNTPLGLPTLERLGLLPTTRFAYDVIDDFAAFQWAPPWTRALDDRLMREAAVVITGTDTLARERRAVRPDVVFVPLGVDAARFGIDPAPATPPELVGVTGPVIGYVGSISERLDLDLLDRLGREFPEAIVAMVGPVHLPAGSLPRGSGNFRWFGLRRSEELPAFVRRFSVALIPFRLNEATRRLNPVKALEYLAAGVPVVSTAIPDVVTLYSDVIAVADDANGFVAAVRSAIDSPDAERIKVGRERASGQTWQAMADRMDEVFGEAGL